MRDLVTRVSSLEADHAELSVSTQRLHERILATENAIDGIRNDLNSGLDYVRIALTGAMTQAQDSMPKWAAIESQQTHARAEKDAMAKGILFAVIVSLVGVIGVLATTIFTHMTFW